MSLIGLCTATADIKRAAHTASSMGGQINTFATTYSSIPCTIQPAVTSYSQQHIIEEFARRSIHISHIMYTPTSISLQAGDIVVSNSLTYLVHGFADQAGRGRVFAAYLESKD